MPNDCDVYLIADQEAGLFKIGISINVTNRISSLMTGSGRNLVLLKSWNFRNASLTVERSLHRKFSEYRTHGEWFRLTNDAVQALIAINGIDDMRSFIAEELRPVISTFERRMPSHHNKDNVKFWRERLFKAVGGNGTISPNYLVKIQHRGRRTTFALHTSNKDAAARRALAIFNDIIDKGWDHVIAERRGDQCDSGRRPSL
jgi:hypothetical protein